jgi:hypothetical protein
MAGTTRANRDREIGGRGRAEGRKGARVGDIGDLLPDVINRQGSLN